MAEISGTATRFLEEPIPPVAPATRHKAARYVASAALDATEARNLLEMLGLMNDLEKPDVTLEVLGLMGAEVPDATE